MDGQYGDSTRTVKADCLATNSGPTGGSAAGSGFGLPPFIG